MDISLDAVVSLIGVACFGLLILPASLRWRMKEKATLTLSLYLALGLMWSIGTSVLSLAIVPDGITEVYFQWLTTISRSAMPLAFGALTLAFLGQTKGLYWYWGIGLVTVIIAILLGFDVANIQTQLFNYLPETLTTIAIARSLEILVWSVATVVALAVLYASFKKYPQAQYRNRFRYWFGGTLILSGANIVILSQIPEVLWIGSALNLIGTLLITYIVMRYHPPDLQSVVNQIVQSITVTAALGVVLFATHNLAYLIRDWQVDPQQALIWLGVIALATAFILPRFSSWIDRTLSYVLFGSGFDETSTIKAYSQNINTDWDFQKLSQQALEFILKEMNVKHGALFVDGGDGSGHVTFELVAHQDVNQDQVGYFSGDNPFIIHLRQNQSPVTMYDLDVLPEYREMEQETKTWLTSLNAELFLPIILRQREMVGIFALGSKPHHKPYSSHDLSRLQIFASQVALDMDKAKLFRQLGSVNQKLGDLSSKFESFDQGKTDFLSIASHELRTPLTHIHGYASMLLEASEDELQNPAYLQHIFNGIAKGSGRLKGIVDLIFDVSKADIGELDMAFGPVSLTDIIKQVIETQQPFVEERSHELTVSGFDNLPIVEGDMPRLVQALNQLLNNAIKYTPDQGKITITAQELNEPNTPPQVQITFADTGIGINPADHERIFDKFYRVGSLDTHSTSSVKFKGAGPGLGLPLAAGIARGHQGNVWVESEEYNEEACPGCKFHFIMPVSQPLEDKKPETNIPTAMAETRHWRKEDIKAVKEKIAKQNNNSNS